MTGRFDSADIPYLQEIRSLLEDTNAYLFYDLNDDITRWHYRNTVNQLLLHLKQCGHVQQSSVCCSALNNTPEKVDNRDLIIRVHLHLNSEYTLIMSRVNGFQIETHFPDNERDVLLFKLFFG